MLQCVYLILDRIIYQIELQNGKNLSQLSERQMSTISYIVSLVSAKMMKIIKTNPNPRKNAIKKLKMLESETNLAAAFIGANISQLRPGLSYTPEEFAEKINVNYSRMNQEDKSTEKAQNITPKQLHDALNKLSKEFGLEQVKGKKSIKSMQVGRRKRRGPGYPVEYLIPPKFAEIKEIFSSEPAIKIIRAGFENGFLLQKYLRHQLLTSFYMVRADESEKYLRFAKGYSVNTGVELEKEGWKRYRHFIEGFDEKNLEKLAVNVAQYLLLPSSPIHIWDVLFLIGFNSPESIND